MLTNTISRAAFLAVLVAATPALADDAALSQTVNSLNQQVQDQQAEINKLTGQLKAKHRSAKAAEPKEQSQYLDAADVAQSKPSVVAPLQPTSLGTLSVSETVSPNALSKVSQAQAVAPVAPAVSQNSVAQAVQQQPAVARTYAPQLPQPIVVAQAVAPQPATPAVAATTTSAPAPVKAAATTTGAANSNNSRPDHVGEAPPMNTKPPEVQALANVGGVLTPYGKVVLEPFFQYSRSSVNSFLFQGVSVVNALLIGAVNANRTSRDLISTGFTARTGINDRTEVEVRIPYVWRQDSLTNTIPSSVNNQTTTSTAQGYGLGDLEIAGHYQINDGHEDWPFFIGNLRFKSDTGSSPYKSEYNSDGTAHTLATGSGFMAIEPSMTVIYPSDPATLFANVGYIHSFGENINGVVGGVQIGNVSPGDTYSASLGMGIALNDRLSFTLGYEHDYVQPTATVVSGATQNSQSLQVGSALSGISFKVNDRTSIAVNLAAGVTKDAPDAVLTMRVPITLQAF